MRNPDLTYPGPPNGHRPFGERRSSGVIESTRRQRSAGACAKDTKLATTWFESLTARHEKSTCLYKCSFQ